VFSSTARRAVLATIAALLLLPVAAEAKKHEVKPGKGTLQRAIDAAKPGDKLELQPKGVYRGGVEIDKELTIKGPGGGGKLPTVDGRCREAFTMLVLGRPVTLKNLRVTGAADAAGTQYGGAEVNFIDGAAGTAQGLRVVASCEVLYGVNVFDSGDVLVTGGTYKGYDDAGIYVGSINRSDSVVEVIENRSTRSNRGVIIEDSAENAGILVANNETDRNDNGFSPTGIFLHNADGVVISGNRAQGNSYAGIHLDASSDDNRVVENVATGNGVGSAGEMPADFVNEGVGNCGNGNAFGSVAGNPLGAC
jgi:parallel beta-helix repeat protein